MKQIYLAALAAALLASGCMAPNVWVTVRPRFDCDKLKTVAVVPFRNESKIPDAGQVMADKIAALLVQRAPYRVLAPEDLPQAAKELLKEGPVTADSAAKFAAAAGADAVLTGTVLRYRSDRFHEVRFYGTPSGFDEGDHAAYYYDEIPEDWFKIDAAVETSVELLDGTRGDQLWSDTRMGTSFSYGSPPPLDEDAVLDHAADASARKLLLGLVPHQERVRVPRGSLVICADYLDHPLDIRTAFTPADRTLYLVVDLDRTFTGKEIALTIEKAGTASPVSEDRFTWDESSDTRVFKKEIAGLVAKEGY
ncbi:MAG: hypothetical protein NT045_07880, partial [Candidatus Aureabacteria bacterium]|nr:hypothetical protein [Candidatus Auribacterota bacterium]